MPFRGIFLHEGNMHVWVTNDARHIPLRMKAKMAFGAIVAELEEPVLEGQFDDSSSRTAF
jgi:hypothetical protein